MATFGKKNKNERRIVIRIQGDIKDDVATQAVNAVIRGGKISDDGNCYCFLTAFTDISVLCYTRKDSKSFFFIVAPDKS